MHRNPAVRDCGLHDQAIFLVAAASISELPVDDGDRQATGMIGLDGVRQFEQLPLGGFRRRERAILLEFHLGCMIAMRMASAGRFSPLAPPGMSLPPNNSFRFFDDLYGVPSHVGERNDG